jgi:DNA invertase Pin-like site-specific DNA recombinase
MEVQEAKSRAWAEAHDVEVVEVVADAGHSAKNLDRPGMERVRELVSHSEVDGVLVHKLDRLTRSVADFGTLLDELERHGCSLASVKDSLDTSSAAGRLVVHITLSVSQWEREVISERTVDALAQARENGTYLGQPPVGYRVEGGRLVPTERIVVVQRAHALRQGGLSMAAIARQLERDGIKTGSGLSRWHDRQVKRLLDAPPRPAETKAV